MSLHCAMGVCELQCRRPGAQQVLAGAVYAYTCELYHSPPQWAARNQHASLFHLALPQFHPEGACQWQFPPLSLSSGCSLFIELHRTK